MVKVYRIEDGRGEGPYQNEVLGYRLRRAHRDKDSHPGAMRDCPEMSFNHFCGCKSLPLLKGWFLGHLKLIQKHGYKIMEYRVPKESISYGKRQLAFMKSGTPVELPWRVMAITKPAK